MAENGGGKPCTLRGTYWFAHEGEQGELESTTRASQRHVLNAAAALGTEFRQPLQFKARVQKAGSKHFPFSSHDNRHAIRNAGEYFDSGLGVRKLDPEKQKQDCHNLLEWITAPGQSPSHDLLTVYQISFVGDQIPQSSSVDYSARRYPKHHTEKQRAAEKPCWCSDHPAPDLDKALLPFKPS